MQPARADILDALKAYEPELIAIRRDIHRHPETGFEEIRTARVVADKLRGWGIDVAEGLAKTGVVGTVRGARLGRARRQARGRAARHGPGRRPGRSEGGRGARRSGSWPSLKGGVSTYARRPDDINLGKAQRETAAESGSER